MQYATLGRTGLVVSRLSFGAMTFGRGVLVPGVVNDIDQGEADRMVARCLDAGVNFFDTADAYRAGESEIMLGRALGGARRPESVIATKAGFRTGEALIGAGLSRRRLIEACEASLKRLATDYVDVYFLHVPDPWTPVEETLRALEDLTRQGKIRYAGLSNFPAWRAAQMAGVQERMGWAPLTCAQAYYSLVGRDLEHEWVPFAEAAGLGLTVWSPLAGGFLTGKYTRDNPAPENTRRESFQIPPVDYEAGYPVIDALQEIAAAHGATPAQIALAWVLARPFVTSAIVGASRFDQLESNLAALEVALSEAELARLDGMTAPKPLYPGWMQPLGHDGKVAEALG
jgi:aryl-alcohol dehydrogenase-like predicted oxidoreductase